MEKVRCEKGLLRNSSCESKRGRPRMEPWERSQHNTQHSTCASPRKECPPGVFWEGRKWPAPHLTQWLTYSLAQGHPRGWRGPRGVCTAAAALTSSIRGQVPGWGHPENRKLSAVRPSHSPSQRPSVGSGRAVRSFACQFQLSDSW